ncbi:curli-like amyloid fiber formation chaperone CsgH [Flavobacterium sp.]|uniref:curli-like amyloid fiber formation chaperone CsgH n=1 Tax=Flavobacterium sp. TaxID=239 RepID=UPI0037523131
MPKIRFILFLIILFPTFFLFAQITNKEVKAKIEIEENADLVSITGLAENLTDSYKSLSYKLTVIKTSKTNNRSNNVQSGRFTLEANQIKVLSKTQINTNDSNQTIILLLIYDENEQLIGKDRFVIGEKNIGLDYNQRPKDGVEITGIVSDETKTKMGKDFYDAYYTEYSKLKLNSSKIIVVEEELTNSRTTRIRIKVDNDILNEFITKPDEEYLASMSDDSVVKTFNYLKTLEKQSKSIKQY